MSVGRRFHNLSAHNLHRVITRVHAQGGVQGTVQAVTDAVVESAGFGVAVVSVPRPGGIMQTVAVAGSESAAAELLGVGRPRELYEEEFAVAQRWGTLLFVPHDRLPDADRRGWSSPVSDRRDRRLFRRWHRLDALYAPLQGSTGELVGVLSVDLPVNGSRPGRRQRELLEILAAQAGIAIDNARMAEQLRAGEELFRWAFDEAGTGMALISVDQGSYGRYVRVNPTFCRIVGRSMAEILTMTAAQLTWPTDRTEDERQLQALAAGTQQVSQRDKRYLRADGTAVWVSVTLAYAGSPDGAAQYVIGQVQDITERRAAHQQLQHRASHDVLTGLPNRAALTDRLKKSSSVATHTGRPGAVLFGDLNGFKDVNDRHGHLIGDQTLTVVAARLAAAVRPGDMVARLGGDEFMVVADDLGRGDTAELARRLTQVVAEPISVPGRAAVSVSISIGSAPIPPLLGDPADLVAAADHAMYTAKKT